MFFLSITKKGYIITIRGDNVEKHNIYCKAMPKEFIFNAKSLVKVSEYLI